MDYNKAYFMFYVIKVTDELDKRNINYNSRFLYEISDFCEDKPTLSNLIYHEHNERYLKQCYYNLQEKYDRGIVSEEEWKPIDKFWKYILASENDE